MRRIHLQEGSRASRSVTGKRCETLASTGVACIHRSSRGAVGEWGALRGARGASGEAIACIVFAIASVRYAAHAVAQ